MSFMKSEGRISFCVCRICPKIGKSSFINKERKEVVFQYLQYLLMSMY